MFINFSLNFIDEMWSLVIDQLCKSKTVSDWILRIPCLSRDHILKLEKYYKALEDPKEALKGLSVLNISLEDYVKNLTESDLVLIMSDASSLSKVFSF